MTAEAQVETQESQEPTDADKAIAALKESVENLPFDDFTRIVVGQIVSGLEQVHQANEVLLDEEEETNLREIDKALKSFVEPTGEKATDEDKAAWKKLSSEKPDVAKAAKKAADAYKKYRDAQEAARNAYRTDVLGQEAKEDSGVDKKELTESTQQQRALVTQSVTLLKTYAEANPALRDFVSWADTLEIPQVGRRGTSTVGQKKPRAQVSVGQGENQKVHENFGEAAKHVSTELSKKTDENGSNPNGDKVEVTAGDLTQAWVEANEPETPFTFRGLTITVKKKETKKESKKAAA